MHISFMLNPPKNIKDVIYNGLKSFNLKHFPDEEIVAGVLLRINKVILLVD